MIWKGHELKTPGDVLEGILACDTPSEAQEFMRRYIKENPHAREDVGYLAGYCDRVTKHRIFEWFNVTHPLYGREELTFGELLELGEKVARGEAKFVPQPPIKEVITRNIIRED